MNPMTINAQLSRWGLPPSTLLFVFATAVSVAPIFMATQMDVSPRLFYSVAGFAVLALSSHVAVSLFRFLQGSIGRYCLSTSLLWAVVFGSYVYLGARRYALADGFWDFAGAVWVPAIGMLLILLVGWLSDRRGRSEGKGGSHRPDSALDDA